LVSFLSIERDLSLQKKKKKTNESYMTLIESSDMAYRIKGKLKRPIDLVFYIENSVIKLKSHENLGFKFDF
jgi:hypothetical protein